MNHKYAYIRVSTREQNKVERGFIFPELCR